MYFFYWVYRLAIIPDDLQQGGLQQHVDSLTGQQVFGLVQVSQAEQQSPGQHQEGRPRCHARSSQLLHCQCEFLQLRSTNTINFSPNGSIWSVHSQNTHGISSGKVLHVGQVPGQCGDETLVSQTHKVGLRSALHHLIELCEDRKQL